MLLYVPSTHPITLAHERSSADLTDSQPSSLARSKAHPIYTDASLNTSFAVHLNYYQNMLLLARKMEAYVREAGFLQSFSVKRKGKERRGWVVIERAYTPFSLNSGSADGG